MRILALYDIHGNPDALAAVPADPRSPDADVVMWAETRYRARTSRTHRAGDASKLSGPLRATFGTRLAKPQAR